MSRDRRWLLGATDMTDKTYPYDNGTVHTVYGAAVLLDVTDRQKMYFIGPGCGPTLSRVDDLVVHVNGETETAPDIYRIRLADMSRSSYAPEMVHADPDWGHEYMARISTDGKWLAYAASTGCHDHDTCDYEIFLHRLGSGSENRFRVTTNPTNDQWPDLFIGDLWPAHRSDGASGDGATGGDGAIRADGAIRRDGVPAPGTGCSIAPTGASALVSLTWLMPFVWLVCRRCPSRPRRG